MTRVEPHLYYDTPIFRGMLYEREGRYPGTPEGEPEYAPVVLPEVVTGAVMVRVVPLGDKVLVSVPLPDDETQPIKVLNLKKQ